MAKQSDQLASARRVEKKTEKKFELSGGPLAGLFAEENEFDRRALWRIGSWGAAAVGAVTLAVMSNQWSLGLRREHAAAADLARQAQQIQSLGKESQNETRRLASAIETLNNDRDRLFSRVTVIEQGLDSVTGALAKQPTPSASAAPQASATAQASNVPAATQNAVAPVAAPVATTAAAATDKPRADAGRSDPSAATPAVAATANAAPATTATISPDPAPPATAAALAKPIMSPPDPAAPKLVEAAKPADAALPDIKPAEAKAADMKMAEARVDARLEAKADSRGPDAALAAASEVVASVNPMAEPEAEVASVAAKRTDFAVDLGSANSLGGLRALWRGVRHVNAELGALNPIVVIREGHAGLGMQLHLAAGPLKDAAAAARICAVLAETKRSCETTVYDGQRLAMKSDEAQSLAVIKAPGPDAKSDPRASEAQSSEARSSTEVKPEESKADGRSGSSRRGYRHAKKEDPPPPPPKPESTSTFSALFGRK